MISYVISCNSPHKHVLEVEMKVTNLGRDFYIQLPAWRPGRYEITNFAKNISRLEAYSGEKKLASEKKSKDSWRILSGKNEQVIIKYNYYAHQMDAGGSWLDEDQVYINFINCLFFIPERINEDCEIQLNIPENYSIASALFFSNNQAKVSTYYELVDSPIVASASISHNIYNCNGKYFHIWIQGENDLDIEKVMYDFKKFTSVQLNLMKEVPFESYHFLIQLLNYKHYHGVEHTSSTVITLGQKNKIKVEDKIYKDLLGVSSHELFHAWNVCSIRPKELKPYDFSKEVYFETGYVIEGVTTYYGDLFLKRGEVFNREDYLKELNKIVKKHFDNYGRLNKSVTDSSLELWLDGYVAGVPHRKVSIYMKGCLIALLLDLKIRRDTFGNKSLDDVMLMMWNQFGKTGMGYTSHNFQEIVEAITKTSYESFFKDFVYGTVPLERELQISLKFVGCQLSKIDNQSILDSNFGFKTTEHNKEWAIVDIAPDSPASQYLSLGDEVVEINGEIYVGDAYFKEKETITIKINRKGKEKVFVLSFNGGLYFQQYAVEVTPNRTEKEENQLTNWLGG